MDYNAVFETKLAQLNDEQRMAVERINGPVMVVAGPGTGKTQLLAMRVANILRKTDTLPNNILCLTFTQAAAANMVDRLASIIGEAAYKVEINTFHGFGSSVINKYSEYFYGGADYQPANELTQSEIINEAIAKLPYDSPLRSRNNDQFVYLEDIKNAINNLKRAALSPDELRQIIKQNQEFCEWVNPIINDVFNQRISLKLRNRYYELATQVQAYAAKQENLPFTNEPKLANVFKDNLLSALAEAETEEKYNTKPITSFKQKWLGKVLSAEKTSWSLKDTERCQKVLVLADIYENYLGEMHSRNLYDFDDMIINVINAIEQNPALKANLWEQYQYILVDEFQDTNDAQMRLLTNLTDYDDQPNLMVVGDDDQAIYRFQGADVSNILNFAKRFGDHLIQINLCQNYRSGADILAASQSVSTGISSRLTNADGSPKELHAANSQTTSNLKMYTASTAEQEYQFIASSIKQLLADGEKPEDIAVISRKHSSLEELVPYLADDNIKVSYDRQQNVLESPLVQLVAALARTIYGLAASNSNLVAANLPLVLASKAFGLSEEQYYHLCINARGRIDNWLKFLHTSPTLTKTAIWLDKLVREVSISPLNQIILEIIGITKTHADDNTDESSVKKINATSPIFNYYFNYKKLQTSPLDYLTLLNDIKTLLNSLKEYLPDQELKLVDFIHFLDQCQNLNINIYSNTNIKATGGVNLVSAHGSKGLEFKNVYIIDAESEQWGSKSKSVPKKIQFPNNLKLGIPNGNDDDERRRLLYVAMTRAKQNLIVTSHSHNNGKELTKLEYLLDFPNQTNLPEPTIQDSIKNLEISLMDRIIQPKADLKDLLSTRLANYQLSATDLNTFVDVTYGGPVQFLLYNLLHLPAATSEALVLGNAIHHTMKQLHDTINSGHSQLSIGQAIDVFTAKYNQLARDLKAEEAKNSYEKGRHSLEVYLGDKLVDIKPGQASELSLSATLAGGIRITGKLDCLDIDKEKHQIRIKDYKTGKGFASFYESPTSDSIRAKINRYRQQLLFYQLLVSQSGQYPGYQVVSGQLDFIEPSNDGNILSPTIIYANENIDDFIKLISSVWSHIINLDLPDISGYKSNFSGIKDFENWLRDNPSASSDTISS